MFRRLRRPGYWIVLLAFLTVYFYQQYQEREEQQRRQALFQLYQSYGGQMLGSLCEGNLSAFQDCFGSGKGKRISLEDIAMFVTTMHLDRSPDVEWKSWEEREGNISLHGRLTLEGNVSYPIDLMMVRQGEKVLLNRLKVGNRTLALKPEAFPLDLGTGAEGMSAKQSPERNVTILRPAHKGSGTAP